jgi:hypothetical protein
VLVVLLLSKGSNCLREEIEPRTYVPVDTSMPAVTLNTLQIGRGFLARIAGRWRITLEWLGQFLWKFHSKTDYGLIKLRQLSWWSTSGVNDGVRVSLCHTPRRRHSSIV